MVIRASKNAECMSSPLSGGLGYQSQSRISQKTVILSREPLISTLLPSYPWKQIAADLFDLKDSTYILVVDYYSRFMEIEKLNTTISSSVVTHLKPTFTGFGIPTTSISDNGPQFDSQEMKEFHNPMSSGM